jgi:hypothetical protein
MAVLGIDVVQWPSSRMVADFRCLRDSVCMDDVEGVLNTVQQNAEIIDSTQILDYLLVLNRIGEFAGEWFGRNHPDSRLW